MEDIFWIGVLLILGGITIGLFVIWSILKPSWNMDSHDKIQTIAILGLTSIAIVALIIGIFTNDNTNIITLAGVAVGGIAGFISQKSNQTNTTSLFSPGDKNAVVGTPLNFVLNAINTAGNILNYSMSPTLPDGATLDSATGTFQWTPKSGDENEYSVTFTATDGKGGSDTKTIKIKVS
jgi:hypothetical protein